MEGSLAPSLHLGFPIGGAGLRGTCPQAALRTSPGKQPPRAPPAWTLLQGPCGRLEAEMCLSSSCSGVSGNPFCRVKSRLEDLRDGPRD